MFSYLATNNKEFAHFEAPEKYTFTFAAGYEMPAFLTSFRGRGGFGAENQGLVQHFFRLSDNATTASTWAF